MKISEIRVLSGSELLSKLDSFKKEAARLRFRRAFSELTDTSRFKLVKKTIARIKFVMSEKVKQNKTGVVS